MLAKLWKKVLLVICIIACIFNIMSKLVAKTSLELNLKSVENGESIMSVFKETQENETNTITSQDTINTETSAQDSVVIEETQAQNTTDFVVIY